MRKLNRFHFIWWASVPALLWLRINSVTKDILFVLIFRLFPVLTEQTNNPTQLDHQSVGRSRCFKNVLARFHGRISSLKNATSQNFCPCSLQQLTDAKSSDTAQIKRFLIYILLNCKIYNNKILTIHKSYLLELDTYWTLLSQGSSPSSLTKDSLSQQDR